MRRSRVERGSYSTGFEYTSRTSTRNCPVAPATTLLCAFGFRSFARSG